tara:strand:- start:1185 stop:2198 length:1014 start_codon:yes stop_codon:yes gene_type:complete
MEIPIPLSRERRRLVAKNPVACSRFFSALIELVFTVLIGLCPEHKSKKIPPLWRNRKPGIFGIASHWFNVIEIQGRGTLHCHALVNAFLSSVFLDQVAENQHLQDMICALISKMIVCAFDQSIYDREDAERAERENSSQEVSEPFQGGLQRTFPMSVEERKLRAEKVGVPFQTHKHGFSCRKGRVGQYMCRYGMGKALYPKDECIQLEPIYEGSKLISVERKGLPEARQSREDMGLSFEHYPFPLPDKRYLSWERQRLVPRDADIVEHSPSISIATGSNNAVYFLGSQSEARAKLFYLVKYITKSNIDPTNCLSPAFMKLLKYCASEDHVLMMQGQI